MRRVRLSCGVAGLLVWLAIPTADAATVGQEVFFGTLHVRAAQGEANQTAVEVEPGAGELSEVVVRDAGAPLEAGAGCEERADGSVACALDLYIVTVDLGDGDDRLSVRNRDRRVQHTVFGGDGDDEALVGPRGDVCVIGGDGDDELRITAESGSCTVDGDAGADVLIGSRGEDRLYGGAGNDHLFARGGADYLNGDDGADLLRAGAGDDPFVEGDDGDDRAHGEGGRDGFFDDEGDDVMRGGPGRDGFSSHFQISAGDDLYLGGEGTDHIRYFCPRCALSLDDRANDGQVKKGERDDVRAETAVIDSHRERGDEIPARSFGTGADRMVGDGGPNVLASQRGPDVLIGNGGRDALRGGRHDDRLLARDGQHDRVHCGSGDDVVVADAADELDGCEVVRLG